MSQKKMVSAYDRDMRSGFAELLYDHSDFYNFGYWTPGTANQREASENLVTKLLTFLPEKEGKILDVACGLGADTRLLLDHYQPQDVVAINISPSQLERVGHNAPGSNRVAMDATKLAFADASFDAVLCVEAAFHFNTRDDFLREAYRVLKPGGQLAHCDVLFRRSRIGTSGNFYVPPANFIDGPLSFEEHFRAAGFVDVEVTDTTEQCWRGFARNLRRWPDAARRQGILSFGRYLHAKGVSIVYPFFGNRFVRYYLLASARKPS